MVRLFKVLFFAITTVGVWGALQTSVFAQDYTQMPTRKNADYARVIRFSNIQADIYYIDQLNGEIPVNTNAWRPPAKPGSPAATSPSDFSNPNFSRVMLIAMLIGFALAIYRYGGRTRASLRRGPTDVSKPVRKSKRTAKSDDQTMVRTQELVTHLMGMSDKRAALIELNKNVLEAAAEQNNLRLGLAETARDLLHRLPPDWAPLSDLRRIVMSEELVQFGGRPLAERTLEDCLRRAMPILEGAKYERT